MNAKPVVLIVEDIVAEQEKAVAVLSPHAEVLVAGWQREARVLSKSRPDITFVILDGYVPMFQHNKPLNNDTTYGLARILALTLPGAKIFSASSDEDMNDMLAMIGAVRSNKQTAARLIRDEILKNTKPTVN